MIKPILFNTGMVRAELEGKKTATRRIVKPRSKKACGFYVTFRKSDNAFMGVYGYDEDERQFDNPQTPPCQVGDILYVRETWAFKCCIECMDMEDEVECMLEKIPMVHKDKDSVSEGCYIYRADYPCPVRTIWHPSIHMPKQATRIWLKVTDVRVERLQDMTLDDFLAEGVVLRPPAFNDPANAYLQARNIFRNIWDSTISKAKLSQNGWDANPWVWVIEFKQCEKPEERL